VRPEKVKVLFLAGCLIDLTILRTWYPVGGFVLLEMAISSLVPVAACDGGCYDCKAGFAGL
jgi:hypothetical protein